MKNIACIFSGFVDMMEEFEDYYKKFGHTFKFWIGPRLVVATIEPDYCEKILNNPYTMDKTDKYIHLAKVGANGLITLNCKLREFHVQ